MKPKLWVFAKVQLRSSFLWDVTPHDWPIGARHLETAWWSHYQGFAMSIKNIPVVIMITSITTFTLETKVTTAPSLLGLLEYAKCSTLLLLSISLH